MKRVISLLILSLSWIPVSSQLTTYLSLDGGPHWNLVKVTDPGKFFVPARVNTSLAGLSVEQEVIDNLYIGTGLYYLPAKTGINMEDRRRFQSGNDSHSAFMVPLRFRYRIQPTEYPVSFSPRIGYIFSLYSSPDALFSNTGVISTPGGTALSYSQVQSTDEPGHHLLEVGVGVGLRFAGMWEAEVGISYFSGVLNKPSNSFTLDYSDAQGIDQTAVYDSQGDGISATLSFRVPVSNLWQNKDYRIRSRIENSLYKGKSVERKGSFYMGGELGALWRLFSTSNPALGARPMKERGILRYGNFHTGIYAGYMLTHELGLDLGVIYQRSDYFYSVMMDHELDFTGRMHAPMYLEIPLRIRYFYDVYREKIYLMLYGGLSALTQFSTGESAGPDGDFAYTEPALQSTVTGTAASLVSRLSGIVPVVRLGLGAEYRVPIKFPLFATASVNYMQGFMAADRVIISIDDGAENGLNIYNGSGWSLDIGVKVPFAFDDRENCVRLTRRKKGKEE